MDFMGRFQERGRQLSGRLGGQSRWQNMIGSVSLRNRHNATSPQMSSLSLKAHLIFQLRFVLVFVRLGGYRRRQR
jgi:hypothetical protein